jgi:hypothetical protein
MNPVTEDFVSQEPRTFRFKIGRLLASSLAGFIAGVVITTIIWSIGVWYAKQLQKIPSSSPAVIAAIR